MKARTCYCGRTILIEDLANEKIGSKRLFCTAKGVVKIWIEGKAVPLSKFVFCGEIPNGTRIDHKNRNTHDHLNDNLRLANSSQNNANRSLSKNNKTGFKGVSWSVYNQKYKVTCAGNHLGYFDSPVDAARAYDEKAIVLFGEFAVLNLPKK